MKKIHLIMPMGGAGSRFFKDGYVIPKPLIILNDKPFFFWATMSILKFVSVKDVTFVVLQEHIDEFQIDAEIKKYFPDAKIEVIPKVLNGAVLTCLEGIKNIDDNAPILFNDCDHSFYCNEFNQYCSKGNFKEYDGALLTFESDDPKYSYLQMDDKGNVIHTVEKKVVSNNAICGAYYFKNKKLFEKSALEYLDKCNYSEYFVSGVYNIMAEKHMNIKNFVCDEHLSFGTPSEYEVAKDSEQLKRFL